MFIISLLLPQAVSDPVRSTEMAALRLRAQTEAVARDRNEQVLRSRQDFEAKFKKLVDALHEFSQEYNQQNGQVAPLKKIQAIQKAIHDLEQTQTWKLSTSKAVRKK